MVSYVIIWPQCNISFLHACVCYTFLMELTMCNIDRFDCICKMSKKIMNVDDEVENGAVADGPGEPG